MDIRHPKPARTLTSVLLALSLAGCVSADPDEGDDGRSNAVTGANVSGETSPDRGDDRVPADTDPIAMPGTQPLSATEPTPDSRPEPEGPRGVFDALPSDLVEPADIYVSDGYGTLDVIRIDARTRTVPGACTADEQSGCTLADVMADTDHNDDIKIDIPLHFSASDYPQDGLFANAELRQRGGTTRLAPQKSFRIKLDKDASKWRDENKLQLNKHPYEATRTRNKLSMDLMADIPHLMSFRTQFTNLWVDDGAGPVDYGLFTHVESAGNRWLERRGLNKGDNLYKVSRFTFSLEDLKSLRVDDEGEPLDEDRFETVLEIESGSDHRPLVRMLNALHDPQADFDQVLDTYFNRNNVMTWMVVNVLLHQSDAVSHNLVLHNPKGTDRFYFVPWDYDGTFVLEAEPPNALDDASLRQRLRYGFARNVKNDFIARWLAQPGVHAQMVEAAGILRSDRLSDDVIADRAAAMSNLVNPYLERAPDSSHNPTYYDASHVAFAASVAGNEAALRNAYAVPLPPTLLDPERIEESVRFAWTPAIEVTGQRLSYELLIASDPAFTDDSLLVSETGLDEDRRSLMVEAARLGSGERYVRLIARAEREPQRFWQVSRNTASTSDGTRYGMLAFTID